MYRQYENPQTLEKRLTDLQAEYSRLLKCGQLDIEQQYDYEMEIADLKDRINYAWQDDEVEE